MIILTDGKIIFIKFYINLEKFEVGFCLPRLPLNPTLSFINAKMQHNNKCRKINHAYQAVAEQTVLGPLGRFIDRGPLILV